MVGPEVDTGLMPGKRWSVGCDELVGELGNGSWQSALVGEIHFVKGKVCWGDQGPPWVRVVPA